MKNCLLSILCIFISVSIHANEVIKVYPENGDMTVQVHQQSQYDIVDGVCTFKGESWSWSRAIAQKYDPINIHGTHLKVIGFVSDRELVVRYMHSQTFGFQQFHTGDEIDFVDSHTLIPVASFRVKDAVMKSDREILLTLDKPVPANVRQIKEMVVENVTYTPEVVIRNNYFSRVPTRGILVTTRRKVLIENNVFFRMKNHGIHIADDARSWYESGMVRRNLIQLKSASDLIKGSRHNQY